MLIVHTQLHDYLLPSTRPDIFKHTLLHKAVIISNNHNCRITKEVSKIGMKRQAAIYFLRYAH